MMKPFLIILFLFISTTSSAQLLKQQYKEDFHYFWQQLQDYYAYMDKKETDWQKVKKLYEPAVDTITRTRSFVLLMEKVFNEIYDHHASLNTNTLESQRLIPTGTDIWAEYINDKPVITEVRKGFGADKVGLRAGMEIVSFKDVPIEKAILAYLPRSLKQPDKEAKDFALRVLLAGKFEDDRKITVRTGNTVKSFYPDRPVHMLRHHEYNGPLETRNYIGNIGYIRINNRLWDNALIPYFDSVLLTMDDTRALILDLRETPSGGNTIVARAILGSFMTKEGFYQKHELPTQEKVFGVKRSWVEMVSPRDYVYTKPLVILVNHWTGSVGEGIAIGFDALERGTIVGTPMAGLNGAIYSYKMPNSGIGFSYAEEKLYHVNGEPREHYTPAVLVDMTKQDKDDLILNTALEILWGK